MNSQKMMQRNAIFKKTLISTQRGLSLIELMVAMFIAAVIFAGIVNTLIASKSAYLYDDEVSYIQENTRFALEYIAREVRDAGYTGGCNISAAKVANAAIYYTTEESELFENITSIKGYEGRTPTVSVFPTSIGATSGTDAFIVNSFVPNANLMVVDHVPPTSAVFRVVSNTDIASDDILMVTSADCSQVGIFRVSTTASTNQIQHRTGGGKNCTKKLMGDFYCNGNTVVGTSSYGSFPPGSQGGCYKSKAFYIDDSRYDATVRSLWVKSIECGNATTSELISGVEDMQVEYGVDTEGANPDGEANRYYLANQITLDVADSGSAWVGWDRVVSARITLVMRSRNPILTSVTTKVMPTLATSYTDKYLYQEVSTIVKIRNSALPANPPPPPPP